MNMPRIAAIVAVTILSMGTARALPLPSGQDAQPTPLILVADGCGSFSHRGTDDTCHRNQLPSGTKFLLDHHREGVKASRNRGTSPAPRPEQNDDTDDNGED